ncbi:L-threonylcarbamoyladenylate synthase [Candidatus Babeliales bacterium]|nr:L-threonylcarbamoyladenylate synthase [Candidatus Babeliales bacterium]MBP9844187.1 L-threonylcarbamoyladenylate synthase [Candidatus Babeliales bacterium]
MLSWNEKDDYPYMIDVLRADGVLLASSDTVLGLFAQLSEKSKQKLDFIKIRSLKPYIVLIESVHLLDKFTDQKIDESMQEIMHRYWPGPLTIIFKAKSTLPNWIKGVDGTIAIRVPAHQGLQDLLTQVGGLFTTSANLSDQPLPMSYDQINPVLLDMVQAVCCDRFKIYDGPASTIIDFSSGSIKVIRMGTVVLDSI